LEAVLMEFTIVCPIDGAVEVGLEDIDTVVLRDTDRADITFVCPHCGTEVTVTAIVPTFLLAAIEALADESDSTSASGMVVISSELTLDGVSEGIEVTGLDIESDDPRLEAYCEYFRRQLSAVGCVEDALDEIDSTS
jgi:hypothetical protein